MAPSEHELKKIAALACVELDPGTLKNLLNDMRDIMELIEQLLKVDTTTVTPLLHPLDLHQRLRSDEIKEVNRVEALAKIAPLFTDDLYLVPKLEPFSK